MSLRLTLSHLGQVQRSIRFNKEAVRCGRSPLNDIIIDDPRVLPEHLKFESGSNGQYVLTNIGKKDNTLLNGERLTRSVVRHGDVVYFGAYMLWISYDRR